MKWTHPSFCSHVTHPPYPPDYSACHTQTHTTALLKLYRYPLFLTCLHFTGTRIIYDRKFLLDCRNSPVTKTPPRGLPTIPGVTTPPDQNVPNGEALSSKNIAAPANNDNSKFPQDVFNLFWLFKCWQVFLCTFCAFSNALYSNALYS